MGENPRSLIGGRQMPIRVIHTEVFALLVKVLLSIYRAKMSKLRDSLRDYFDNTPEEILKRDLDELEYLNKIGPDAIEYVEKLKEYFGGVLLCSDFETPTYQAEKKISPDQKYYLAA